MRELAEKLLADNDLTERLGNFLATAPGGPSELRLLGSRLSYAATVEPLRRAAPKAGRGRPARWGSERRDAAEALALDRARLDALRRWIVAGRDDGSAASHFEGDLLESARESVERARRKRVGEKVARFESGEGELHAPRLWAARVLLKVTGRASTWADAERLVKRLTDRAE